MILIYSCNDLSCISSDCSFFSRFLILLILVLSSTTPVCLSTSSNNFPLLTTFSKDTVGLVKQNLRNFWEWIPSINCVFMCLSTFSKLLLLAIDLRQLQNCWKVSYFIMLIRLFLWIRNILLLFLFKILGQWPILFPYLETWKNLINMVPCHNSLLYSVPFCSIYPLDHLIILTQEDIRFPVFPERFILLLEKVSYFRTKLWILLKPIASPSLT